MATNMIHPGLLINYAPAAACTSGTPINIAGGTGTSTLGLYGIPVASATAGAVVPLYISGEFSLPALSTETFTKDAEVRWEGTAAQCVTTTSTTAIRIGTFDGTTGSGKTSVNVILNLK